MTFEEWWEKDSGWGGLLLAEGQLAKAAWEAATLAEREACTNVYETGLSKAMACTPSSAVFGVARATGQALELGWDFAPLELERIRDEVDADGWSTCLEQVQLVLLALERRGVVVTPNAALTGAEGVRVQGIVGQQTGECE